MHRRFYNRKILSLSLLIICCYQCTDNANPSSTQGPELPDPQVFVGKWSGYNDNPSLQTGDTLAIGFSDSGRSVKMVLCGFHVSTGSGAAKTYYDPPIVTGRLTTEGDIEFPEQLITSGPVSYSYSGNITIENDTLIAHIVYGGQVNLTYKYTKYSIHPVWKISISPNQHHVLVGENLQLFATGIDPALQPIVELTMNWSTSDSSIGYINQDGLFSAANYGTTVLTVNTEDIIQQTHISVCDTISDFDGNTYFAVKIGDQIWMSENLSVTHYRNGMPIPMLSEDTLWSETSSGAYCQYNNDPQMTEIYGNLYNWSAVTDSNGLAPDGWHVPSDDEWQTLVDYLGGNDYAGGILKETGTTHWAAPNAGALDSQGFTALPGGYRMGTGVFVSLRAEAALWSSTDGGADSYGAWYRDMYYWSPYISRYFHSNKKWGYSVRCVKD